MTVKVCIPSKVSKEKWPIDEVRWQPEAEIKKRRPQQGRKIHFLIIIYCIVRDGEDAVPVKPLDPLQG